MRHGAAAALAASLAALAALAALRLPGAAAQERFELARHVELYDHMFSDSFNSEVFDRFDLAGNLVLVDGRHLYAMDYLGAELDDSDTRKISVLERDPPLGAGAAGSGREEGEWTVVQEVPLSNSITPAVRRGTEAAGLARHGFAASRDGAYLYVADNGGAGSPRLDVYERDPGTGFLSLHAPSTLLADCPDEICAGDALETSVTVSDDDRTVVVTARGSCSAGGYVYTYTRVPDDDGDGDSPVLDPASFLFDAGSPVAATAWAGGHLVVSHNSAARCSADDECADTCKETGPGQARLTVASVDEEGSASPLGDSAVSDDDKVLGSSCITAIPGSSVESGCAYRGLAVSPDGNYMYVYGRSGRQRDGTGVLWARLDSEDLDGGPSPVFRFDASQSARLEPRNRKDGEVALQHGTNNKAGANNGVNVRDPSLAQPWIRELCVSQSFVYAAVRTPVGGAAAAGAAAEEAKVLKPLFAFGIEAVSSLDDSPSPSYDDLLVYRRDAESGALEFHSAVPDLLRAGGLACTDDEVLVAGPYGVSVVRRVRDAPRGLSYGGGDAPEPEPEPERDGGAAAPRRRAARALADVELGGDEPELLLDAGQAYEVDAEGAPLTDARLGPSLEGGGEPLRYEVSPPLPDGLELHPRSGAIHGTPAAPAAASRHVVTALAGRGGEARAAFRLAVRGEDPACSYGAGTPFEELSAGESVTIGAPTGADGVQFSVEPPLPPGLRLDAATGVIAGEPAAPSPRATYAVRCAQVGRADGPPALLDLEVGPAGGGPGLWRYESEEVALRAGEAAPDNRPAAPPAGTSPGVAGGGGATEVVTYEVSSGALPAGLAVDAQTGAVRGTPDAGLDGDFVAGVRAVNARGEASPEATLSFTVRPAAPAAPEYPARVAWLAADEPAAGLAPSAASLAASPAGSVFAVAPPLPGGLELNATTGEITGVPGPADAPLTEHVVSRTSSGGRAEARLYLAVRLAAAAGFRYEAEVATFSAGAFASFAPAAGTPSLPGGSGAPVFRTTDALPEGLALDGATGVIGGTPAASAAPRVVTVEAEAEGAAAPAAAALLVEVLAAPPLAPEYPALSEARVGVAVTLAPLAPGDEALAYSVFPPLPAGLALAAATGVVSGTPAAARPETAYAVTARDAAGRDSPAATLRFAVRPAVDAADLTYELAPAADGLPARYVARLAEGEATSFEAVAPGLPEGLTLDPRTGAVDGVVIDGVDETAPPSYGVRACGGSGECASGAVTPRLVPEAGPGAVRRMLVYPDAFPSLRAGVPLERPLAPSSLPAGALAVEGDLPPGLEFDPATGEITGTPEVATAAATVQVVSEPPASGEGVSAGDTGRRVAVLTFEVLDEVPRVSLGAAVLAVPLGTPVSVPVTLSGGRAATVTTEPALPAGLELSDGNDAIVGTPSVLARLREYEVVASNTAGESRARLALEVVDAAPALLYAEAQFLAAGREATVEAPRNTGGAAEHYTVAPPLPDGLALDAATGVISGTPRAVRARQFYRVAATNSGGEGTAAFLELTVNEDGASSVIQRPVTVEHDTDPFNKTAASVSLVVLFLFLFVGFLLFLAWRSRRRQSAWQEAQERRDARLRAALAQFEDVETRKLEEDRQRREAEAERRRLEAEEARRPLPLHLIPAVPDRIVDLFAKLRLDPRHGERLVAEGVAVRDLPHLSEPELNRMVPHRQSAITVKGFVTRVLVPQAVPAKVQDWIESDDDLSSSDSSFAETESTNGGGRRGRRY